MAVFKIKIREYQEIVGFDSRDEAIDHIFGFLKQNLDSTDPSMQSIISIENVSDTQLTLLEDPDYVSRHPGQPPVTMPPASGSGTTAASADASGSTQPPAPSTASSQTSASMPSVSGNSDATGSTQPSAPSTASSQTPASMPSPSGNTDATGSTQPSAPSPSPVAAA